MSDELYDSLEDESTNSSSTDVDKLTKSELISLAKDPRFKAFIKQNSFKSEKNEKKEMFASFTSPKTSTLNVEERNFLPDIKKNSSNNNNNSKGAPELQKLFNQSADYDTLTKKGLLCNRDGSFSKSETEELPFITREYKNMVFQKKKIGSVAKKTPLIKTRKAVSYSGNETTEDELFPVSGKEPKVAKASSVKTLDNDNLTDSMKRMLLLNQYQKRIVQSRENTPTRNRPKYVSKTKTRNESFSANNEKKHKSRQPLDKRLLQFDLSPSKNHRLTYVERHQLENGYNPLFLRQGGKKIATDTTRSNYGESTTAKLSEVSSRILSADSLSDSDEEEQFYKKIIEKEKKMAGKVKRGKSECSSLKDTRPKCVCGSESPKEFEKARGSGRSIRKKNLKPIDIKCESKCEDRKSPHCCEADSPKLIKKTELVLRGKAYGYLANARNILKFKSKEQKPSGREKISARFDDLSFAEVSEPSERVKMEPLPVFSPPRRERNKFDCGYGYSESRLGNGKEIAVDADVRNFYLPRVSNSESSFTNANLENIMRISFFLRSSEYENEQKFNVQ